MDQHTNVVLLPREGPASRPRCDRCRAGKKGCSWEQGAQQCVSCSQVGKSCVVSAAERVLHRAKVAKWEKEHGGNASFPAEATMAGGVPGGSGPSDEMAPPPPPSSLPSRKIEQPNAQLRDLGIGHVPGEAQEAGEWPLPVEMQAEPESYKKYQVGDFRCDLTQPGAYLAYADQETGEPQPLFDATDVDLLARQKKYKRSGYLEHPVYPFEPAKAKSVIAWVTAQGEKHGFAAGTITWDKELGQWVFPEVPTPPMSLSSNVKTTNTCGSAILCCAEIKTIDPPKDFVFYYASLHNFAKKLVRKIPVQMIYPHRFSHGENPYTKYKYLFNTITYYEPRDGGAIEPILRRFGCNSLQGDDVVEFAFGDNWDIKIDEEGRVTKKDKVNDRGKEVENDKDGEGSGKTKKKRKNKKRKPSKKGKEVDNGEDGEDDENGEDGEHVEQGGVGNPIEISDDAEPIGAPDGVEHIEIVDDGEEIQIVEDVERVEISDDVEPIGAPDDVERIGVPDEDERIENDQDRDGEGNDKGDENDDPAQANKGKAKKRRRPNKKGKGKEIESVEVGEGVDNNKNRGAGSSKGKEKEVSSTDKNREASSNVKDGENEHPRMVFSTHEDMRKVEGKEFLVRLHDIGYQCSTHPRYFPAVHLYWVRYQPAPTLQPRRR